MDNKPQPGVDKPPVYSWQERIVALALLLLIIAAVWILIEPPAWLRVTPAAAITGRDITDPYLGNPDAPVEIIEYNDFACGKCREWHQSGVKEKILEKYGDQVVFIWRDFPNTSSYTRRAAEAAQCANDQGKFWEYHDYLFENAQGFMDAKLIEYAGELGLDVKKFDSCFIGGELRGKVLRSRETGYLGMVRITPTFVINGKIIVGPLSFMGLSRAIDEILLEEESSQGNF
ncbi:MAG: DsbA family protein [Anaerolineaceae bacterium]